MQQKRIGERLIESGLITAEQLKIALEEQKRTGELIGAILFSLGFISRTDLFTVLSMVHSSVPQKDADEGANIPYDIDDIVRQSTSALRTVELEASRPGDIAVAPVVRLVDRIITVALQKGATDIHIGPDANGTRVRYRVDGLLQHGMYLPRDILSALVSRIKIMGAMNIAENRLPQDGATEFPWQSKMLDLRISSFPVLGGENIVVRILDKSRLLLGLENLGFMKDDIGLLNKSLVMPYGLILVTGPTGSGKTTTLYSLLSIINSVYKNIFTIEDPIEYQLPLVRQSQVNIKAGLTFATGLRSILRQDPDVILVGEMRDVETAELAIRSSLTGHLVFSTLHTNDAASSLPRIMDMGIEPFLLASTVDTIIAQRLVRLLCTKCREAYAPTPEMIKKFIVSPATDSALGSETPPAVTKDTVLYRAKGCSECGDTGYRGRTVIYEIFKMNEELRRLVLSKKDADQIFETAIRTGLKTMYMVGIQKAAEGLTSLEEVHSATRIAF